MKLDEVKNHRRYMLGEIMVRFIGHVNGVPVIEPVDAMDYIGNAPGHRIIATEEIADRLVPVEEKIVHGTFRTAAFPSGKTVEVEPLNDQIDFGPTPKDSYDTPPFQINTIDEFPVYSVDMSAVPPATPAEVLAILKKTGLFFSKTKPKSLVEFAKQYIRMKDSQGIEHPLQDYQLEMLAVFEQALKTGATIRTWKMRNNRRALAAYLS